MQCKLMLQLICSYQNLSTISITFDIRKKKPIQHPIFTKICF